MMVEVLLCSSIELVNMLKPQPGCFSLRLVIIAVFVKEGFVGYCQSLDPCCNQQSVVVLREHYANAVRLHVANKLDFA